MGAVGMYLDSLDLLGIHIAADVTPPVDHKHGLPRRLHLPGKDSAEQPRPHDQIIIPHGRYSFAGFFTENIPYPAEFVIIILFKNSLGKASLVADRIQILPSIAENGYDHGYFRDDLVQNPRP